MTLGFLVWAVVGPLSEEGLEEASRGSQACSILAWGGHLCGGLWPSSAHQGSGTPTGAPGLSSWRAHGVRGPGQARVGLAAMGTLWLLHRQPNSDLLVFTVGKV